MRETAAPTNSFIKRHRTGFTILGALIVFATFVVKENLRDRWREKTTAIELAQYIYSIQMNTNMKGNSSFIVGANVSQLYWDMKDKEKDPPEVEGNWVSRGPLSIVGGFCRDADVRVTLFDSDYASLQVLDESLGADKQRKEELSAARQKAQELHNIFTDCEPAIWAIQAVAKMHDTPRGYGKKEIQAELQKIDHAINDEDKLYVSLVKHAREINEDAQFTKERNKRHSDLADIVSVVLYVIGWTLGIIGKLYGSGDLVGAE